MRGRHTGSRRHTRCLVQDHSPRAAKAALAPAPRHFPRASLGSLHPHRQSPRCQQRMHLLLPGGKPHHPTPGARCPPQLGSWGQRGAVPGGSRAAPRSGAEDRRRGRGAQRLEESRERAGRASEPRRIPGGCGGAAGGMGAAEAEAARRPPQPRCLSFGLCGGGGSSTSSTKHCAKHGRAGEAPPDPPQRRTTPTPRAPRRARSPAGTPRPAGQLAGRAPTTAEGYCTRALAGSPPRCSRPVPRQAP